MDDQVFDVLDVLTLDRLLQTLWVEHKALTVAGLFRQKEVTAA
jgi:hypothetical protein